MGITAGCSVKRRSFESGGARLILILDQKEKKGRKKPTKSKNKKTPNKQTSQIENFQNPWKGVGCIYLDFNVIFRIQPKTFLHAPQMVGRASSIFNVLYVNLRIMSVIWKRWCVPILCKKKTTLKNVATSLHTISRSCLPLTSLPPILTCRETINLQCHWN